MRTPAVWNRSLCADRDSVQRSAITAAREFCIQLAGFGERLIGGQRDEAIQIAVRFLSAQRLLHQLFTRHLACTQRTGCVPNRRHEEITSYMLPSKRCPPTSVIHARWIRLRRKPADGKYKVKRVDECVTLHDVFTNCLPAFGGAYLRRIYTILDHAIGSGCPLTVSIAGPVTVSGQHLAWLIPLIETGWIAYISTTDAVCYHDGHRSLDAHKHGPIHEVPIFTDDAALA